MGQARALENAKALARQGSAGVSAGRPLAEAPTNHACVVRLRHYIIVSDHARHRAAAFEKPQDTRAIVTEIVNAFAHLDLALRARVKF
jgi:hypothetical protein